MVSFAVSSDLAEFWRPLTPAEKDRVDTLLAYATAMIRRRVPNIDARIESGDISEIEVRLVTVAMVKRVMLAGDTEGVTQTTNSVGQVSESRSYGNPMGSLYLSRDDLSILSSSRSGVAFTVDLTPSST